MRYALSSSSDEEGFGKFESGEGRLRFHAEVFEFFPGLLEYGNGGVMAAGFHKGGAERAAALCLQRLHA